MHLGAKSPYGCRNYFWLTDKDRVLAHTNFPPNSPKCDNTLRTRWYRFDGLAGSAMPTECVPTNHCGALAPGWLLGSHPFRRYRIVRRSVCFHWNNDCCRKKLAILVVKCDGFFAYRLIKTPLFLARLKSGMTACSLRYCGDGKTSKYLF